MDLAVRADRRLVSVGGRASTLMASVENRVRAGPDRTSLPNPGKTNSPFFLISFVGERAERIEEYSSGSFVVLRGFGKCVLKFCLLAT
jgi:hypothetical protein